MDFVNGCGALAARMEAGGRVAKGFLAAEPETVVENGFALLEIGDGLVAPKSDAPRSCGGCVCGSIGDSSCIFRSFGCVFLSDLNLSTSLIALILPIFLVQDFFLHPNMCSLRSSLGKCAGKSPLSCSSKEMKLLQTVHFASFAGGGVFGSSQVCQN